MPQACQICNNPDRLQIDREIVAGKSKSGIASRFGVPAHSVSYHAEHHVSRQMAGAWVKKQGLDSLALLADIEDLVGKARLIFDRNFEKNSTAGDMTALNAIREQRGVFELLCKIAALYHEARALELQNSSDHLEAEQAARRQDGMARLTFEEAEVLLYLTAKMEGEEIPDSDIPSVFRATTPPPPVPLPRPPLPPPLPRPKLPPATVCKPDYTIEDPDPSLIPGPDPEPEQPKGLPPEPLQEIPGGQPGLKVRRHLLGRKIAGSGGGGPGSGGAGF